MSTKTKKIVFFALFTALVCVATMVIKIPSISGYGYVNFGDAVIFMAGSMLGGIGGMVAGGVGSALADLFSGYAVWAPLTLIIKGAEGFLSGFIANAVLKLLISKTMPQNSKLTVAYLPAFIISAMVMVLGYYLGGALLVIFSAQGGEFVDTLKLAFATSLGDVAGNIIQGSVSVAIGFILSMSLLQVPYVNNLANELNKKRKAYLVKDCDFNLTDEK